jgi:hypothetical protein
MVRVVRYTWIASALAILAAAPAASQALSLDVEALRIPDVGSTWQTIDLVNTYSSAVVVCTYNLRTSSNNEATVRIRNVGSDTFDVRTQQFEDSPAVTPSDVHCLVADEGNNTLADGRVIEARTVSSTVTAGLEIGWGAANTTNVTSLVTGGHSNLVILGQVMSFGDNEASVFWTNNCTVRGTPATLASICVGKHIGQINDTRATETLGFIVTESGTGTVNQVDYAFARGGDTIRGVGNGPPYQYTVSGNFDTGVASNAAENGVQGGWAVLYGNDPLPNNRINLAVDEETVAGDMGRSHTTEELYYGVFRNNQTAVLNATKTTEVYSGSAVDFAVPGSDILYTLNVESTGTAPVDDDTFFLVDTLPDEVSLYSGDIDDGGPEGGMVIFDPQSSGLTFNEATDLGFSTAIAKPTSMAECGDSPVSIYDSAIRHICFAPQGQMLGGAIQPNAEVTFTFRGPIA